MNDSMQSSFHKWGIAAIVGWVILMLVQAIATPLHIDESYYWMYSKDMAWGYFDHPPFVAVLIWLSDKMFNGTLGVRFLSVFCQLFTFYLIYKTITKKESYDQGFLLKLFLAFCLLPLNHLFGFITTPDVPLMLSAALFFYSLRGVVEERNKASYLLWTLSMAMMLYSKYHSGLVILFTLIALPSLFRNWKTYASGGLALLLFVPHILWQYEHDWVSFAYHLSDRVVEYSWTYPFEYLGNVLVVCNPFLIFFLVKLVRNRWSGEFERACYFVLVGFLMFFMWQSFRVRVQPQWLIVIYIPALFLLRKDIASVSVKKMLRLSMLMLPIFVALRVFMIWDLLPEKFNIHGMKEYTSMIKEHAGDREVMFYGSYKRASIYSWYQGQEYTHSYNGSISRKNQYNLWFHDSIFYDKDVYLAGMYSPGRNARFYKKGKYYGNVVNYKPCDKLKIVCTSSKIEGDSLYSEIIIENPYGDEINYDDKYILAIRYLIDGRHSNVVEKVSNFKLFSDPDYVYEVRTKLPKDSLINGFTFIIRHENLPYSPIYNKYQLPTE